MSSSAPSTTFSSSTPTDTSGESTEGTPRGANYFFGFLITFVGLLIIFIVCGIGSRRRLARRRGLNDTLEPSSRFRKLEGGETRPEFYEPPLVPGEDRWNSLMPLSVRYCREKEGDSVDQDLQPTPLPAAPTHPRSRIFPFFNRHKTPPLKPQTDPEPPDTLQIAVMIAMPWNPSLNRQKSPDDLREYQIGEISFPWNQNVNNP